MKEYNRAIDWIIYSFRLRNSMSKCRLIIDYIIACLEANSKAHNINVETSSNYLFIDFELSLSRELVLVFKASINNGFETIEGISDFKKVQSIHSLYDMDIGHIVKECEGNNVDTLAKKILLDNGILITDSNIHNPNIIDKKSKIDVSEFKISAIGWNDIIYEPSMENLNMDIVTMTINEFGSVAIITSGFIDSFNIEMESLATIINSIKHLCVSDSYSIDYEVKAIDIPLQHDEASIELSYENELTANSCNTKNNLSKCNIELAMGSKCHINRKRLLSEMYGQTLGSIKNTIVNSWNYIII